MVVLRGGNQLMRKQQEGYGQGVNANCFSQSNYRAFCIFEPTCLKAGRCIFLEWLWRNWEVLTKVVNDGRWTLIYTFTLLNKLFQDLHGPLGHLTRVHVGPADGCTYSCLFSSNSFYDSKKWYLPTLQHTDSPERHFR